MHSFTTLELVRLVIIVAGGTIFALSMIFSRPWLFAVWLNPAFWLLGASIVWASARC